MYTSIDGVKLFFDVEGASLAPSGPEMRSKPTLLLLHGGPGMDHSLFRPAFSALADVAQVVYLDHRGQGRSDRGVPEDWNLARWAEDVHAFCEALGIERPVVLGHSFGGIVAMAYATRYPEHPAKLILANTMGRHNRSRMFARFEELGGQAARKAAEQFWTEPSLETMAKYGEVAMPLYSVGQGDPEAMLRVRFNSELMLEFAAGEMQTFNLLPDLAKISCPTLVLGAVQDPVTSIGDQEDIVAALTECPVRFERLDECSHMSWSDQPERVMTTIREFLLS